MFSVKIGGTVISLSISYRLCFLNLRFFPLILCHFKLTDGVEVILILFLR